MKHTNLLKSSHDGVKNFTIHLKLQATLQDSEIAIKYFLKPTQFNKSHICFFCFSFFIGAGVDESFQRIGERLMDVFNTPLIVESHYNESIEITKFQPSRSGCCQ